MVQTVYSIFCNRVYLIWWNSVIFCDERKYYIFVSDERNMVWRNENEGLKIKTQDRL